MGIDGALPDRQNTWLDEHILQPGSSAERHVRLRGVLPPGGLPQPKVLD